MPLVFATHNQHKFDEVKVLLPKHINLISLTDIGCMEEIAETGKTLKDNAALKANYVAKLYGYPCFADDTGLLVDALNGAPGVHSARYAGEHKNDDDNIHKLLNDLKHANIRTARFETVIALSITGENIFFTGSVEGEITKEKYGSKGFGYDPIFKPIGFDKTFGELPLSVKNKISHRGRAINQLITYLKTHKNVTE